MEAVEVTEESGAREGRQAWPGAGHRASERYNGT